VKSLSDKVVRIVLALTVDRYHADVKVAARTVVTATRNIPATVDPPSPNRPTPSPHPLRKRPSRSRSTRSKHDGHTELAHHQKCGRTVSASPLTAGHG
jgi:hypothetical protein